MTNIAKRNFVMREVTRNFEPPKPTETVCKVLGACGNQLYKVTTKTDETFLASMPTKYRNIIYVTIGSFVLTEPIAEGKKVKAEITKVLVPEQIKYLLEIGGFPEEFTDCKFVKEHVIKFEKGKNNTTSAWDFAVPDSEEDSESGVDSDESVEDNYSESGDDSSETVNDI